MKTKLTLINAALLTLFAHKSIAQANQKLSNLKSPTAVNQHLLPDANNVRNLGGTNFGWKNIYFTGRVYFKNDLFIHASGSGSFFAGTNAGNINMTGQSNTGVGYYSLSDISSGSNNTAQGYYALNSNASGYNNSAFGAYSLQNNTSGGSNTGLGEASLHYNTTGSYNAAMGNSALYNNTTGYYNTASGTNALYWNTTGSNNTATGYFSLYASKGEYNTAYGSRSLYNNTTGYSNVANGYRALYNNTSGYWNTSTGTESMVSNTTGASNTANGYQALYSNTTGFYNVAIGRFSLYANTTAHYNTAAGYRSLETNTTGMDNTGLGAYSDVQSSALNNATALGAGAVVDASNKVRIGNTSVTSIGGQVGWTIFSDGRYKKNIKENIPGLAFINSLRPISYTVDVSGLNNYFAKGKNKIMDEATMASIKSAEEEGSRVIHTGFVAQEVEEAAKKFEFDFSGVDKPKNKDGIYGLRYDNFVVPLVKAVQELSKQNEELKKQQEVQQKQIEELKAMIQSKQQNVSAANASAINLHDDAALGQNIPNPSKSYTAINYTLPQKYTRAQLLITDNNGKILRQENLNGAGKGSMQFNTAALASGTYHYSLIVDGKNYGTKQMVVAK